MGRHKGNNISISKYSTSCHLINLIIENKNSIRLTMDNSKWKYIKTKEFGKEVGRLFNKNISRLFSSETWSVIKYKSE